jgi:hypothetical protein
MKLLKTCTGILSNVKIRELVIRPEECNSDDENRCQIPENNCNSEDIYPE